MVSKKKVTLKKVETTSGAGIVPNKILPLPLTPRRREMIDFLSFLAYPRGRNGRDPRHIQFDASLHEQPDNVLDTMVISAKAEIERKRKRRKENR